MTSVKLATKHSYEELRGVVIDILLGRESVTYEASQWNHLQRGVAEVLGRRENANRDPYARDFFLHDQDAELVRDVFWDLFRQGFITLGWNDSNPTWPFFRLSHFGEQTIAKQSLFRFHDTGSYIAMVRKEVPDVSSEAVSYLEEAVATFYADCLLACSVMIGVAAEAEFLRLVDVSANSKMYGTAFASVPKQKFVRQKITTFQESIQPLLKTKALPNAAVEDLDTNLSMIQSVLRIARNEAGHPAAAKLQREQVYVYLQLFVPFARQLMRLRDALK